MPSFKLISATHQLGVGFKLQEIFQNTFGNDADASNCTVHFFGLTAQFFSATGSISLESVDDFIAKFEKLKFVWADILVYVVANDHQQSLIAAYVPKGNILSRYFTGMTLARDIKRHLPQKEVVVEFSRGYLTISVVTNRGDLEEYEWTIDEVIGSRAVLFATSSV